MDDRARATAAKGGCGRSVSSGSSGHSSISREKSIEEPNRAPAAWLGKSYFGASREIAELNGSLSQARLAICTRSLHPITHVTDTDTSR